MQHIYDTGLRGYLKWLQQDQPQLYRAAAPVIAQKVPDAFSDHEQSLAQASLMGFGDDGSAAVSDTSIDGSASAPDVATAANAGPASPGVVGAIQAIVNGIASLRLQGAQLSAYSQINAAQLQHAAAAGQPLTVTSGSMGIPLITGVGATNTLTGNGWVMIAGILGVLWLFGHRQRA